ncbi:Lcl C-terminal domain-containing protein [Flexibacterium corallicola]|uniref:Lcl C-terminal domain-containing protein n=1 Tax=Flexibacterium corallicola TaxID=3037259 RepID=UPI00286EB902|nr:DUF1566 domain-containing protein [Pseudovibrio sp. M1P-2-3]
MEAAVLDLGKQFQHHVTTSKQLWISMLRLLTTMTLLSLSFAGAAHAACTSQPESSLILNKDTASDPASGLVWKRCAVGMSWNETNQTCSGQPEGLTQDTAKAAAKHAGQNWRVPTGRELETLIIEGCDGYFIDRKAFPNIEASNLGEGAKFWTSTEAMIPNMFYFFDLTHINVDMHSSGYDLSVLLVKDL